MKPVASPLVTAAVVVVDVPDYTDSSFSVSGTSLRSSSSSFSSSYTGSILYSFAAVIAPDICTLDAGLPSRSVISVRNSMSYLEFSGMDLSSNSKFTRYTLAVSISFI